MGGEPAPPRVSAATVESVSPRAPRRPSSGRLRAVRIACASCALLLLGVVLVLALSTPGAPAAGPASASARPAPAHAAARRPPAIRAAAEAPCGPATPGVVAAVAGEAAERIYRTEIASSEVAADRRQVESYAPLLQALRSGSRAGVQAAVTALVYSGTHIVRLRVSAGGHVLSDVGGPYIIAPVRGTISTGAGARATYVLSVQDDLGYVKLEDRFLGLPMLLRGSSGAVPVEGVIPAAGIPASGPVRRNGISYEAWSFDGEAFPAGRLQVTILVRLPAGAASVGCARARMLERAAIAQRTWQRFVAIGAGPGAYVGTAASLTHSLVYVRRGSQLLAGSQGPGPAQMPDSGALRWRGSPWSIASFPAGGGVRVYLLAHT